MLLHLKNNSLLHSKNGKLILLFSKFKKNKKDENKAGIKKTKEEKNASTEIIKSFEIKRNKANIRMNKTMFMHVLKSCRYITCHAQN